MIAETSTQMPRASRVAGPFRGLWIGTAAMVVLAVTTFGTVAYVALRTGPGIKLDQRMMESVGHSASVWVRLVDVMTAVTVGSVAVCLAGCMAIALVRGRFAVAAGAALLVAGANVTTQVLKHDVFHRLDGKINGLPSGHTTVSLSLGVAAVLVAPAVWRWVIVPAAGFVATYVAAGTLVGQWHRPADVVAGIAVCLAWTGVALALITLLQRRRVSPGNAPVGRSWLALAGSALVGLVFTSWGLRPLDGDVNMVLALGALIPIGLMVAGVIAWAGWLSDRYLA